MLSFPNIAQFVTFAENIVRTMPLSGEVSAPRIFEKTEFFCPALTGRIEAQACRTCAQGDEGPRG